MIGIVYSAGQGIGLILTTILEPFLGRVGILKVALFIIIFFGFTQALMVEIWGFGAARFFLSVGVGLALPTATALAV